MQKSDGQLNALYRLKSFLNTDRRKSLVNSFIYANYNYCRLIWHFYSKRLMDKIERITVFHNTCNSDCNTLLKKLDKFQWKYGD